MEMILLKDGSPEWEYAWNWLSSHPLNKGLEFPDIAMNNNEAWQYVGSYRFEARVVHEFRHRCFPLNSELVFLKVHASPNMNAEDIERVVTIM